MAQVRLPGFQPLPPVIKNLVIINALVWLAELTFKDSFVYSLSLHYHQSPEFKPWQLVTYMFLHDPGSILHLLFNMFTLWMFGSTLENLWGAKRFLLFYLICGVGAGIVQMAANFVEMNILMGQLNSGKISQIEYWQRGGRIGNSIALGASGAVAGVMAANAYLFPNNLVYVLPFPFPIKLKYMVIGYFLIDLFSGINPRYGSGIAHFAHIGGALFGLILVITMNRTNRRTFY